MSPHSEQLRKLRADLAQNERQAANLQRTLLALGRSANGTGMAGRAELYEREHAQILSQIKALGEVVS